MTPILSFDLDHTLMINPFRRWVFPEIEAWLSPFQSGEESPLKRILREHLDRLNRGQPVTAYDWDDILLHLAREAGTTPPFTVEELVRKHAAVGKVWLFSDVLPTLKHFQKRRVPLAAATNGYARYQLPVTDCLGLTPFFSEFHTPDNRGTIKPLPDFFRFRGERSLIHTGDRLDQDILGANRAGVISVWICRDLPSSLRTRPLLHRKDHPGFREFLTGHPNVPGDLESASDFLPDYVIVDLTELIDVWELETNT